MVFEEVSVFSSFFYYCYYYFIFHLHRGRWVGNEYLYKMCKILRVKIPICFSKRSDEGYRVRWNFIIPSTPETERSTGVHGTKPARVPGWLFCIPSWKLFNFSHSRSDSNEAAVYTSECRRVFHCWNKWEKLPTNTYSRTDVLELTYWLLLGCGTTSNTLFKLIIITVLVTTEY